MSRLRPYTELGLRRLPCHRCGAWPSVSQWQACADGNVYRPLCRECDVELNELLLRWVGDPTGPAKMAAYRAG